MSAAAVIADMQDWLAMYRMKPAHRRTPADTILLRTRLYDFVDELIAAHEHDGLELDEATFEDLLTEIERIPA